VWVGPRRRTTLTCGRGYSAVMRRSGIYVAVALLMILASAAGSDASSEGKPVPCPRVHPGVLVADAEASVYQGGGTIINRCEVPGSAKISARAGRGRAYVLGPAPWGTTVGIGGVADETLDGSVLAYEQYSQIFGPHSESRFIMVRDLRTGRLLHSAPIATPAGTSGPSGLRRL